MMNRKGLKVFRRLAFLIAFPAMAGCQPTSSQQQLQAFANLQDVAEDPDATCYGVCGEGTSSQMLELINTDGDTVYYKINTDGEEVVRGGLMAGDRIAVVGNTDDYGEQQASVVLNLTSLLGRWTSIDKDFEIQEGGVVVSHVPAESKPWHSWKVLNGKLLMDSDTFAIAELGADSLCLENSAGIFVYERMEQTQQ